MHSKATETAPVENLAAASDRLRDFQSELKVFRSRLGQHAFVVDGSRVYDLIPREAALLDEVIARGEGSASAEVHALFNDLGLFAPDNRRRIRLHPIEPPLVTGLSLNVAQACNMSCRYCYADEG